VSEIAIDASLALQWFLDADDVDAALILTLPDVARSYDLTNYDAAYLELAIRRNLPLATTDQALRRDAGKAGVPLAEAD
jgi:predicted nucleic acid-binding protein